MEHSGHKSKSDQQVHVRCIPLPVNYCFCLFNKNVKILQEKAVHLLFIESMDGLFHKITECCLKYGAIKATEKLLKCCVFTS